MGAQKTRLAKGMHARPQLQGLQEWGEQLDKGMLIGVRVDRAERHIEGSFWLALVMGPAFPAPAHMALQTDVYEEGWLIVPVKWNEQEDKERRGYKLQSQLRYIVVNATVRLAGLRFEGSQGGPQGRVLRNQAKSGGLSFLGLDTRNLILAACDEE